MWGRYPGLILIKYKSEISSKLTSCYESTHLREEGDVLKR